VPNPATPQQESNPSALPGTMSNTAAPGNTQAVDSVTVSPFTEPNEAPGSPLTTDPAIVPITSDPAGPTITSPANPNQIGQSITIGVQTVPDGNAALGTPTQPGSSSYLAQSALVP
jgi:hypothetical protein